MTTSRALLRSGWAALALLTGFTLGCGLSTGGVPGSGGTETTCASATDCDDGNPCTKDRCNGEGVCEHATEPDGLTATQKAGDCLVTRCAGGALVSEPDDTDVGSDDNDCTLDSCSKGVLAHDAKPTGSSCTTAQGVAGSCGAGGACVVECSDAKPCPDMGACATASCNATLGVCDVFLIPDGTPTPGVAPVAGDCHQRLCFGGVDTNQIDVTDLPLSPTDCDEEHCAPDGTPSNPPRPADSPCSTAGGQVCNGDPLAPACVECTPTTAGKCPGVATECQHPACINNACTITLEPAGTAVGAQVPGDCHKIACDGAGGVTTTVDDTDPPTDGNDCTTDTCVNGVPAHTPIAMGSPCGAGGVCVAGPSCGCTSDAQCTAPATCIANHCGCVPLTTCPASKTCGVISDGCYGTIDCDDGKSANETDVDCGGDPTKCATRCAQGKACSADGDCATNHCVDGVCCEDACVGLCQACSAAKKGQGLDGVCGAVKSQTDPDDECMAQTAETCGTTGMCDGAGACARFASGTTCAPPVCAGHTITSANTCDGTGTCVAGAPYECAPYNCGSSTACATSCSGDGNCASGNFCNGWPNYRCQGKLGSGALCFRNGECQSNVCVFYLLFALCK